jgi:hypothetical protein
VGVRDTQERAAARFLERLPRVLLGDGSPLIAVTAALVGLISAWPEDNHPPLLTSHGGHSEVYAWVACNVVGAALIVWGIASSQWRVQVAGLILAGTGLAVYGIAFATAFPHDSAAVGVPPMVLGAAAGFRIVVVAALGVTWETRQGGGERDGG